MNMASFIQFYLLLLLHNMLIALCAENGTQYDKQMVLNAPLETKLEHMQLKYDNIIRSLQDMVTDSTLLMEQKMNGMRKDFDSEIREKSDRIKQLEEKLEMQRKVFQDEIVNLKQKLDASTQDRRVENRQVSGLTGSRVAFYAYLTHSDAVLQSNERVVFDSVVTNLGLAYHGGVFTAPVPGIYVFSVNLLSDSHPANAKLVKNGMMVGALNFHADGEQASQSVTLELNKDDEIAVQSANYPGVKFFGYRHSTFTGFLLYEFNHPLVGK